MGLSGEVKAEKSPDLETTLRWIENKMKSQSCDIQSLAGGTAFKIVQCDFSISNLILRSSSTAIAPGGECSYRERDPYFEVTRETTYKLDLNHLEVVGALEGKKLEWLAPGFHYSHLLDNHWNKESQPVGVFLITKGETVSKKVHRRMTVGNCYREGDGTSSYNKLIRMFYVGTDSVETAKKLAKAFKHLINLLGSRPENQEDLF